LDRTPELDSLVQMQANLEIMQELYESGLDASIGCMADVGFLVELGMEGAIIDATHARSYAEASEWLKKAAVRHYPASIFGRKYGGSAKVVTMSKPLQQPFWTS